MVEGPPLIWFNGSVVPWGDANVHVWSEASLRGASVFEGVRAYWHAPTREYYCLAFKEHAERLGRSAKLLRFPPLLPGDELIEAMSELLKALNYREHAYLRPTVYLDDAGGKGVGSLNVTSGMFVACFRAPVVASAGISCCISAWRRSADLTLSPRIKSGGGFLGLRVPRIEASERWFDDVILLNERDTVAEASGANLFMVRHGAAVTPPVSAGLLEGITRRLLLDVLPRELGVAAAEREISRTELYIADEVFLCSTLHEIQPVTQIDGFTIGAGRPGPVTALVRDYYRSACEAGPAAPANWLTPLGPSRW